MTDSMTNLLRGLSLAALLMAGSCAAPTGDANGMLRGRRPQQSHHGRALLSGAASCLFSGRPGWPPTTPRASSLSSRTTAIHGNGSIAVSAPAGVTANVAIAYMADRINTMGIPRDHIIVTTHDAAPGDLAVELNYVSYQAHTDKCGDWSEDLSMTADNSTPPNFGCSVQQNIAAMVADPRDLLGPRPMDDGDGHRRQTVITSYEQGQDHPPTSSHDLTTNQTSTAPFAGLSNRQ